MERPSLARKRYTLYGSSAAVERGYGPPAGSYTLVARPRLLQSFSQGLARPLTLISAPPGFGKTTLVASWIAEGLQNPQPSVTLRPAVWLAFPDSADNDPARFWIYMVAALRRGLARRGRTATLAPAGERLEKMLELLQSNSLPAVKPFLDALINELDRLAVPLVLVLDDYHLIQAGPIQQGMSYLLGHLPKLHLVLLTRIDPPLPIHRLPRPRPAARATPATCAFPRKKQPSSSNA